MQKASRVYSSEVNTLWKATQRERDIESTHTILYNENQERIIHRTVNKIYYAGIIR